MSSSINAIDRMMATRGSKANEEAEEKKRARASPHKAPPPDPKKGRSHSGRITMKKPSRRSR